MEQVLIFAGTTEGRRLAECLSEAEIPSLVCVATEYGETLLPEGQFARHHAGRLSEAEMEALMKEQAFHTVIDATHPYAVEVSANIRKAAELAGLSYRRLLREQEQVELSEDTVFVDSVKEAVSYLEHTTGKILASTGSKELSAYTALPDYKERVFARVLSTEESVRIGTSLGFVGRNLICMQGPFSEEMNTATMKQFGISWLVTKASGKAGGYGEKIRAAKQAGARVLVVGRPEEVQGDSFEEVLSELLKEAGKELPRIIELVSIGTGSKALMTGEADQAFRECDAVVGAGRMVEALDSYGKPSFASYRNQEILDWIIKHPQYRRIAVAFSGDLGFYSGAKTLLPLLKKQNWTIRCLPGISSLIYLADRLGISWDDARLMSIHGRRENLIRAVREQKKVLTLLGGAGSVAELCRELQEYGLEKIRLTVGENLSYEDERITSGTAEELKDKTFAPLAVLLLENPDGGQEIVTHGIPDEEFLRDQVPMTKFEVRAVSLSRLELKRDSIVYDVGAGTGSVSVEAARQAAEGMVYAIERKPEAVALIEKNKRKFGVSNLEVIAGLAPEAMEELPAPTHVFIGGSAGNMREILELVFHKNPAARVVVNAIALETVAETMTLVRELPVTDLSVSQVMAARGKRLGSYEMMMGMNPVYIISFTGSEEIQ